MNPPAKIKELLRCIDEVICVGGRCHRRKAVLLFFSRSNFKFLGAKKEAQEAFKMTKLIIQSEWSTFFMLCSLLDTIQFRIFYISEYFLSGGLGP
jgi:hypothetical protein